MLRSIINTRKKNQEKEPGTKNTKLQQKISECLRDCTSRGELIKRMSGTSALEFYGIVPNLFDDLTDDDLRFCVLSYLTAEPEGETDHPVLAKKLNDYADLWEKALADDKSSDEDIRRIHAKLACYNDLKKEAAERFAVMAKTRDNTGKEHNEQ